MWQSRYRHYIAFTGDWGAGTYFGFPVFPSPGSWRIDAVGLLGVRGFICSLGHFVAGLGAAFAGLSAVFEDWVVGCYLFANLSASIAGLGANSAGIRMQI
jgi:hypothetical protein